MGTLLRIHDSVIANHYPAAPATMATYETAENHYATVNGIRFAYRRLGGRLGIPLVMLMHFRSALASLLPSSYTCRSC